MRISHRKHNLGKRSHNELPTHVVNLVPDGHPHWVKDMRIEPTLTEGERSERDIEALARAQAKREARAFKRMLDRDNEQD